MQYQAISCTSKHLGLKRVKIFENVKSIAQINFDFILINRLP